MFQELNERSRDIFRHIVDAYLESGEPIGSKALLDQTGLSLSSASVRNVMARLESQGLLYAPHTSAGRMPTQKGLRLYVDGLMEVGNLNEMQRAEIEAHCMASGHSSAEVFERASGLLSGLSDSIGLVVAPKTDKPIRHIQFVRLDSLRALCILVTQDGLVENRIISVPEDLPDSSLEQAANYLNHRLGGKTLAHARADIKSELHAKQARLDQVTAGLVEQGIAMESPGSAPGHLIVRGQSRLLNDVKAIEDIESARQLFEQLENHETSLRLLDSTGNGEGVQIYIGTENRIFEYAGWSMVISPYKSSDEQVIGAIGVIGPTRINYGRIIPVVDYTSQLMSRILGA